MTQQPRPRSILSATIAAVLAATAATSSPAQSGGGSSGASQSSAASDGLESVVVTARRREEDLQTVPLSVTAISGEQLEQKGVTNLFELQKFAPSLRVVSSDVNPKIFFVSLRGIRGTNPRLTEDQPISNYFAEAVVAHPIGFGNTFYDLESVQVLKGPQGTLFGRNTVGGAVLIEPRKPKLDEEISGNASLSLGQYDLRQLQGGVNLPLGDRAAVRVAGQIKRQDGYTRNVISGAYLDETSFEAGRVSLLLEPNDRISSTTIFDYLSEDSLPTSNAIGAVYPVVIGRTFGATSPVIASYQTLLARQQAAGYRTMQSMVGSNIITGTGIDTFAPARCVTEPFRVCRSDSSQNETIDSTMLINNTRIELGSLTLKNIASWRDNEHLITGYDIVPGAELFAGLQAYQFNVAKQFSEELQLSGKAADDRLSWIGGLFLFREYGEDYSPAYQFGNAVTNGNRNQNVNRSRALFAQGDYAFNDQWTLTLGVRRTQDEREAKDVSYRTLANGAMQCEPLNTSVTPPIPIVPNTAAGTARPGELMPGCFMVGQRKWSAWTGNISLQFEPVDKTLLYAAVRRGYRSGGFSPLIRIPERFIFNPEFATDVELGVKSDWSLGSAPVRTNLALFRTRFKDQQVQISEFVSGGFRNFTDNAGRSHLYGAELEVTVLPSENFEINAFGAFIRAKYDEYLSRLNATTVIDLSATPYGGNVAIPKFQGGLSLAYKQSLGEQGELRFGVDAAYRQRTPTENEKFIALIANFTPQLEEPSRTLVNARIDWRNAFGKPLDFALYGTNLTDETYLEGGSVVIGVQSGHYGPPRMWGVEVQYRFGADAR